jgi:DNA-binding protein HU-beta
MNKSDLIDALAARSGESKAAAGRVLEAFLETVAAQLVKGESVTLVGFGSFSVSKRAAREGRNPRSGETIEIKASKVAKFSPGAGLKSALNPVKK